MKKVLIFVAVIVLLMSGCADKKEAQSAAPQQEATQDASTTQAENSEQQASDQSGTQASGDTQETLQELGDLLEELDDEAVIDFAE